MKKKILQLALCMASIGFAGSYAQASSALPTVATNTVSINAASPQWRDWRRNDRAWDWQRNRRYNDRFRTEMRTQVVRRGWGVYRETYQIRYLPNGRTQTYLVNRVRIR